MAIKNQLENLKYSLTEAIELEDLMQEFPKAFYENDTEELKEIKDWLQDYIELQRELVDNAQVNSIEDVFNAMDTEDAIQGNSHLLGELKRRLEQL